MDIRIFKTLTALNESFTLLLQKIVTERESVSIALSGGSTPKALFDYWSELPEGTVKWEKIRFFWGDERCVPPDDVESNYRMTQQHLFNGIKVPKKNIFRIRGEADPKQEAERYAALLQRELEVKTVAKLDSVQETGSEVKTITDHISQKETELETKTEGGDRVKSSGQKRGSSKPETKVRGGIPVFDLVMLGMGDDGHTASIFPNQISLWNDPRVCITTTHPISGQQRVSITGSTINAARNVAFLITGTKKAEKIGEIINHPVASETIYPAARVKPKSGNLFWFLDEEAARLLQ